jgi:hypothetical protein
MHTIEQEPNATDVEVLPVVISQKPKATPRDKWGRLTVELPMEVIKQIKQRAVDRNCTAQHIVMLGLRSVRIAIKEEDMAADGRIRNGRKT